MQADDATCNVSLSMSVAMRAAITAAAHADGRTLSSWARAVFRRELERLAPRASPTQRKAAAR